MVEATELRLGNIVHPPASKAFAEVTAIRHAKIELDYAEYFREVALEPVPLTEEWLEKFGFTKHGVGYMDDLEQLWITFEDDVPLAYLVMTDSAQPFPLLGLCEHVHTTQNIRYALCKEELTTTEEKK